MTRRRTLIETWPELVEALMQELEQMGADTVEYRSAFAVLATRCFASGCKIAREVEEKPMKIYGIDVSYHQGQINWDAVAAALRKANGGTSPGFAILRAGYSKRDGKGGLNEDKQLQANINGCMAHGVPFGFYVYCYDESPEAARITMQETIQRIQGCKPEYPVIYDVEYEPYNTGADGKGRSRMQVREDNTALIKAALETLEDAGYYATLYCSRNFFVSYTNLAELDAYDKWEAAYVDEDTAGVPNGIWQYSRSNALEIPGFGNSLDCNVAYKDYPAIIKKAGLNGWGKEG